MTKVVIRPLHAGEEDLFLSMPDPAPIGHRGTYDPALYAPARTWVALRGDRVVARAAWAALPGEDTPVGLDWFDLNIEPEVGAELLTAAQATLRDRFGLVPEYHLYLNPGWRDRPEEVAAVELRLAAARLAGLELKGERLRTVWTAVDPAPEPPGLFEVLPASPELVSSFGPPDILTGVEYAFIKGVRMVDDPLASFEAPQAFAASRGAGFVVADQHHGDSWWIAFLALNDDTACRDLLFTVTKELEEKGAAEIYADTETHRPVVLEALAAAGYRQIRARLYLTPTSG